MSLEYDMPLLDLLEADELSLGVPVVGDAVQVNAGSIDRKERLSVIIEPPEIRISREDGTLLSIEEVRNDLRPGKRVPILARPVAELVLKNVRPHTWDADTNNNLRVYDRQALFYFLDLIASHAVKKQRSRG